VKSKTSQNLVARERAEQLLARRREILALPPEAALNAILELDQPLPLVHSMAPQDLHLLIRDIGPDDAVVLLSLASNGQWDYLLDMETWHQDRLDTAKVMRWLDRLQEADGRRLGAYLFANQPELLALYLFRNVVIYMREHDQEATELPPDAFSLDGMFYIRIPERDDLDPELDAARRQGIKWLIEDLAARDYFSYQKIMLEAVTVIPAEMEEDAYRLRNVRLAERGVPPFHEAVGIYQPLSRRKIRSLAQKARGAGPAFQAPRVLPILPGGLLPPDQLLARAMDHIADGQALDRVRGELAYIGNALVIADRVALRGRDDLTQVMTKAVNWITMGLERLAGRMVTPQEAGGWLERVSLQNLLRVGRGSILDLHGKAKQWTSRSWFTRRKQPLSFWDETGMGILGGILLKQPRLYDPRQRGELYREFASLTEVAGAETQLNHYMALDDLLEALDVPLPETIPDDQRLTYKNLLLTLWVQSMHGREDGVLEPLDLQQLPALLARLFAIPGSGEGVVLEARADFLSWLAERSGRPAGEIEARLAEPMEALFKEIGEELGGVAPKDIDPRYFQLFLVQSPA